MNQQKVCEAIRHYGPVSIFRGLSLPVALKAAKALHEAGVRLVEVTFNTPQAEAIITALCKEFEGELIIGAGTVLDQSVLKAKKRVPPLFWPRTPTRQLSMLRVKRARPVCPGLSALQKLFRPCGLALIL